MGKAEPSCYIDHLMSIHLLQRAGYPLAADDLSLQTWTDLGILRAAIDNRRPRLM